MREWLSIWSKQFTMLVAGELPQVISSWYRHFFCSSLAHSIMLELWSEKLTKVLSTRKIYLRFSMKNLMSKKNLMLNNLSSKVGKLTSKMLISNLRRQANLFWKILISKLSQELQMPSLAKVALERLLFSIFCWESTILTKEQSQSTIKISRMSNLTRLENT